MAIALLLAHPDLKTQRHLCLQAIVHTGFIQPFYLILIQVFFQLEKSLDEYPALADLDVEGMRRSEALEEDLDHFFGESWRTKEEPEVRFFYEFD